MCRLFGMSGAPGRVRATFWLLDAPDSLAEQSRREPDGTGLGCFAADGTPEVHRRALAAYEDRDFARDAREATSETFVAHVRYASTGAVTDRNTHPFEQRGRLFAHNGVVAGLDQLDAELGDQRARVLGETDSERVFALITQRIDESGGDVTAGIVAALGWIAERLPVFALNVVLATPRELWAVRYPDQHELYVLERDPGGSEGDRRLEHASAAGTRVHSADLADSAAVVIASERMDDDPAWRLMAPGELLHVDGHGAVSSQIALPTPPAHRLTLDDLEPGAAGSQATG